MYIAALIISLVTPLSMFLVGFLWRLSIPSREKFISYRSELALKSEETWEFAHKYISKLWVRMGVILTVLTLILMIALREHYAVFVLWLIMAQMVFFCGSVFFVDSLMKVSFDENGNSTLVP